MAKRRTRGTEGLSSGRDHCKYIESVCSPVLALYVCVCLKGSQIIKIQDELNKK